jgi:hypothetical protein
MKQDLECVCSEGSSVRLGLAVAMPENAAVKTTAVNRDCPLAHPFKPDMAIK